MTTQPTRAPRSAPAVLTVALTLVLLAACGSSPYAAGSSPAGGGTGPDAAVSATDLPLTTSPTPAAIQGVVRDAAGTPVVGALVGVVSRSTPAVPIPEIAVLTDTAGHYAWFGLPPGDYDVTVTRDGLSGSGSTVVVAGRSSTVDVTAS